jgi:hypothetical protein
LNRSTNFRSYFLIKKRRVLKTCRFLSEETNWRVGHNLTLSFFPISLPFEVFPARVRQWKLFRRPGAGRNPASAIQFPDSNLRRNDEVKHRLVFENDVVRAAKRE